MRGKARYYRVRLVAYDSIKSRHWHLPSKMPSPSPTPRAPNLAQSPRLHVQRRPLRKTLLVCMPNQNPM